MSDSTSVIASADPAVVAEVLRQQQAQIEELQKMLAAQQNLVSSSTLPSSPSHMQQDTEPASPPPRPQQNGYAVERGLSRTNSAGGMGPRGVTPAVPTMGQGQASNPRIDMYLSQKNIPANVPPPPPDQPTTPASVRPREYFPHNPERTTTASEGRAVASAPSQPRMPAATALASMVQEQDLTVARFSPQVSAGSAAARPNTATTGTVQQTVPVSADHTSTTLGDDEYDEESQQHSQQPMELPPPPIKPINSKSKLSMKWAWMLKQYMLAATTLYAYGDGRAWHQKNARKRKTIEVTGDDGRTLVMHAQTVMVSLAPVTIKVQRLQNCMRFFPMEYSTKFPKTLEGFVEEKTLSSMLTKINLSMRGVRVFVYICYVVWLLCFIAAVVLGSVLASLQVNGAVVALGFFCPFTVGVVIFCAGNIIGPYILWQTVHSTVTELTKKTDSTMVQWSVGQADIVQTIWPRLMTCCIVGGKSKILCIEITAPPSLKDGDNEDMEDEVTVVTSNGDPAGQLFAPVSEEIEETDAERTARLARLREERRRMVDAENRGLPPPPPLAPVVIGADNGPRHGSGRVAPVATSFYNTAQVTPPSSPPSAAPAMSTIPAAPALFNSTRTTVPGGRSGGGMNADPALPLVRGQGPISGSERELYESALSIEQAKAKFASRFGEPPSSNPGAGGGEFGDPPSTMFGPQGSVTLTGDTGSAPTQFGST